MTNPKTKPGIYRLHWCSGGSSLASVGQFVDGSNWYAPTNWLGESERHAATSFADAMPWSDWTKIERIEREIERADLDRAVIIAAGFAANSELSEWSAEQIAGFAMATLAALRAEIETA